MWFHALTIAVLLILLGEFEVAKAGTDCSSITVDPSGSGHFWTIQSAIDSISSGNNKWTCIDIKAGTYREKVNIPLDKPYTMLRGQGSKNTFIEWNDSNQLDQSYTFGVFADNVKVWGITFTNTYNTPFDKHGKIARKPAVAVFVKGDKCSFYQCRFVGLQDTLWDAQGKHYFDECDIVGAVDFILGSGQSIYQSCVITVLGDTLNGQGFITAQGRSNEKDEDGFVFKNCNIIGTGSVYLGRPWRDYARVLFYQTSMSNIVIPIGWDPWHIRGHEDQLTFAESECSGPGSNTAKRVPWENKMSEAEVKRLVDISYIDSEGWINNQPI